MSGLVSGYSGIIAPPNLITNGSFRVNQRELFTSGFEAVASGDYVCDAWFVGNQFIDFVEVHNQSKEMIRVRGNGKKGQLIDFKNRDRDSLSTLYSTTTPKNVTASFTIMNLSGVPVSPWARPQQRLGYETQLYTKQPTVFSGQAKQCVEIREHIADGIDFVDALMRITLQEDGDFDFLVTDYMQLAGAYKNPPKYAPVPYADDLVRCQRYYQKGTQQITCLGGTDATYHLLGSRLNFPTSMVTVPTTTISSLEVYEETTNTNEQASYTSALDSIDAEGFRHYVYKTIGGNKPRLLSCAYTAEVV